MDEIFVGGDIGGTNYRLVAFLKTPIGLYESVAQRHWSTKQVANPLDPLRQFVQQLGGKVTAICLGVAGPVEDFKACTEGVNLPWGINAHDLGTALQRPVWLLNDFEAFAHSLELLTETDLRPISTVTQLRPGNRAAIGAGTGLGEAGILWNGSSYQPFGCEGSHGDFGPGTAAQDLLLGWLRKKYGHVSWERVVSGPALLDIFTWLQEEFWPEQDAALAQKLGQSPDPGKMITEAALAGTSQICRQALSIFLSAYGAEAGNLALKYKATGGVFIGGGIAPQIADHLNPRFMNGFLHKGRFRPFMEQIPVFLVLNPQAALLGAAHFAARQMHE